MQAFFLCTLLRVTMSSVNINRDPNILLSSHRQWISIPDEYYNGLSSDYPQPPVPYSDSWMQNSSTILVMIAALREKRCKDTVYNLLTKAAYPDRINFIIIQQNAPGDDDCLFEYCAMMALAQGRRRLQEWDEHSCPHFNQIQISRDIPAAEAKGPVYARAIQSDLVDDENFCLQIDAHCDAVQNWDWFMMQEWGHCKNEYAVLTTYAANIEDIGQNIGGNWEVPHMCDAEIQGFGIVANRQARAARNLQRPIIAPLWAAGLSFSKCHLEKRVPNDIHQKHVFSGEEFSRGARLWTHGYDFYTPTRAYIGTYYGNEKLNIQHWDVNGKELDESHERMATLLKWEGSDQSPEAVSKLGDFGIGEQRSLEDYLEFSGVDTRTEEVDMTGRCLRKWIEWDDSAIKVEVAGMGGMGMRKSAEGATGMPWWQTTLVVALTVIGVLGVAGYRYNRRVDINDVVNNVLNKYGGKGHME